MQLLTCSLLVIGLLVGSSECKRKVSLWDDNEEDAAIAAAEAALASAAPTASLEETKTSEELDEISSPGKSYFPIHSLIKKKKKYPLVTFITRTETSTTTFTTTSSTVGLCAKLVNVTGPCRLRRGLWVEDPIVMTFDDDMDVIDGALSPTSVLSIETTPVPEVSAESRDMTDGTGSTYLSGSVIEPSTASTELDADDEDLKDQRLGFSNMLALANVIKTVKKRLKFHLVTVITTSVSTTTTTSTYYTTVSIKTFFIQLCTPSPFPFNICAGRK